MKHILPCAVVVGLLACGSRVAAEERNDAASVAAPLAEGATTPSTEPSVQLDFVVESTITRSNLVEEAPEMPGLPPAKGRISVTLNRVDDPDLADPPPLPPLNPDDPAVKARLAELRENYKGTELVFVTAHVHDHARTLVRWYPNGQPGAALAAWSNIDFNHFSAFAACQVTDAAGDVTNYGLLMGVGNFDTARLGQPAAQQPACPELPPLADGPAFVVVEGDATNREAMRIIEGMHEMYRVEGARMAQAYMERLKAEGERRAFLLANPPEPKDVTIHYWKRGRPANGGTQTEGGTGE